MDILVDWLMLSSYVVHKIKMNIGLRNKATGVIDAICQNIIYKLDPHD